MSATAYPSELGAARCDGCKRVTYNVKRAAVMVAGSLRSERALCPSCLSAAIDAYEHAAGPHAERV